MSVDRTLDAAVAETTGLAARPAADLDARFRGPLMSFFMRRLRNRSEAEDLTQQVFLRILAAQRKEQMHHPEGFVFTVATNLLRDRSRQHGRRGDARALDTLTYGELMDAGFVEPSPERILIGRERLRAAFAALGELDGHTGEIFVLSRLDNLRQRDIAQRFGIGLSTVEKHIMRANRSLGWARAES